MADSSGDGLQLLKQGAEAKIYAGRYLDKPVIIKERFKKAYRHPALDKSLTSQRTKSEARAIIRCRMNGIKTPAIYLVDQETNRIYMEHITDSVTVRDYICEVYRTSSVNYTQILTPLAKKIGSTIGTMHEKNIIHGDLTTSNMLLKKPPENLELVMIDFGLGYIESVAEDKGVDLYVLERAMLSTHPHTEELFQILLESYVKTYGKDSQEVVKKLDEVRLRGRKRTMVG